MDLVLACERTTWGIVLALLAGCTPAPPEVADTGLTSDPMGSTTGGTTTDSPPGSSTGGSATAASADGTGTSSGSATTLPVDGTTTEEPATTSEPAEGSSSSSDGGMMEGTTGDPVDCHPLLVEVLYDPMSGEDQEQWIKLYNPCATELDLGGYSLGWGGPDYTFGTLSLVGAVDPGDCFIVGGPQSEGDNASPLLDQAVDLDPTLDKAGDPGNGVALFLGSAASIMPATIPLDAVIYGVNNGDGLLDAEGNTPDPHVGDAGDTDSIRRTAPTPTWTIEANPMPNVCPPF